MPCSRMTKNFVHQHGLIISAECKGGLNGHSCTNVDLRFVKRCLESRMWIRWSEAKNPRPYSRVNDRVTLTLRTSRNKAAERIC